VVAHSSVLPSHGSSGAPPGRRNVMKTFRKNAATLSAIVNAPIVDRRLRPPQPVSAP